MKKKLTITLDEAVLLSAKEYARDRRVTLSSLIETSLRDIVAREDPSFSERWRGRFQLAEKQGDPRFEALARKGV